MLLHHTGSAPRHRPVTPASRLIARGAHIRASSSLKIFDHRASVARKDQDTLNSSRNSISCAAAQQLIRMASIDSLRERCTAAGQEHLLDDWDSLSPSEQQELAAEIQVLCLQLLLFEPCCCVANHCQVPTLFCVNRKQHWHAAVFMCHS
jgi:hypothetical protein